MRETLFAPELFKPIPEPSQDPLVPIGPFSAYAPTVFTSGLYAGEHECSPYFARPIEGATVTAFLRKSVAERLEDMQQSLPPRYHLVVFNAYTEEDTEITPPEHFKCQAQALSPHRTGSAVDLAIVKMPPELEEPNFQTNSEMLDNIHDRLISPEAPKMGTSQQRTRILLETNRHSLIQRAAMLNFGTSIGYGGERARLTYFEEQKAKEIPLSEDDIEAMQNRRILYNLAQQHELVPRAEAWWHLDASDPSFGPMKLGTEHLAHEELRRAYLGIIAIKQSGGDWPIENNNS